MKIFCLFLMILLSIHDGYAQPLSDTLHFYDPTMPPNMNQEDADNSLKNAHIDMIFRGQQKKIVIINGTRYSENEYFGDFLITEILENRITLENQKDRVTLYFSKGFSQDK